MGNICVVNLTETKEEQHWKPMSCVNKFAADIAGCVYYLSHCYSIAWDRL